MFRSGISWINNAKTGLFCEAYIVESFSTTKTQSYYILLSDFQIGKMKRGLSRINHALHLY